MSYPDILKGLRIGKENDHVAENLDWFIKEAIDKDKPLHHVLFVGSRGSGKSTLMERYGKALETYTKGKYIYRNAENILNKEIELLIAMTGSNKRGVIALDEIHSLNIKAAEEFGILLSKMDEELNGKQKRKTKWLFTLLGATTKPEAVSKPLKNRMITLRIEDYSIDTLSNIAKDNITLSDEAANLLANISDTSPRDILIQKIRPLKSFLHQKGISDVKITEEIVREWMGKSKIDKYGLLPVHRKHITTVYNLMVSGKKTTLRSLVSSLRLTKEEIMEDIEIPLLRLGFIDINSSGRSLTSLGHEYYLEVVDSE